jgi:hypothetical protein
LTRIYENRGYWWRQTISFAIVVLVTIYGGWELWQASNAPEGYISPLGQMFGIGDDRWLFGVAFLFGGIYGGWQLIRDSTDIVASVEKDAAGNSIVKLWRPFGPLVLRGDPSALTNWRVYIKLGSRNQRTIYIYADHSGYPRPLQFDLRRGDPGELRTLAPEAVAEFEAAMGRKA